MERTDKKILVICGPTATGKTALAVFLAKKFNGELVSADSRQVYTYMDIGTGKDKESIDVPIHMIDVIAPDQEFSVSHYRRLASRAIEDIVKRGKLPIIVGGTGLYIRALLHNLNTVDVPPDPVFRKKAETMSVKELQQQTTRDGMNNSDWNNPRRLIRKIEIANHVPIRTDVRQSLDSFLIGLTMPMPDLQKRIQERVAKRIAQGALEEFSRLRSMYGDVIALQAPGYRSVDTWGTDEYSYAKRQMTWFKKDSQIHWFDARAEDLIASVTDSVLAWYTKVSS